MFRPSGDEELKPLGERTGDNEVTDTSTNRPSLYDAVFSSCSARSQSCSGEPSGQPRSAQYFSAKRAISSREGAAAGVCFLAAGFRRLAVPFAASALLVVICVSLIQPHLFAHQSIQGHLHDTEEREQLSAGEVVTLGLPWLESPLAPTVPRARRVSRLRKNRIGREQVPSAAKAGPFYNHLRTG